MKFYTRILFSLCTLITLSSQAVWLVFKDSSNNALQLDITYADQDDTIMQKTLKAGNMSLPIPSAELSDITAKYAEGFLAPSSVYKYIAAPYNFLADIQKGLQAYPNKNLLIEINSYTVVRGYKFGLQASVTPIQQDDIDEFFKQQQEAK